MIQGSYNINDKFEPFVRYEWMDVSDAEDLGLTAEDTISLVTFGFNHYFNKHNAKFTLDVVWALDPLPSSSSINGGSGSGLGLLSDDGDEEDQMAVRAQFQLLF